MFNQTVEWWASEKVSRYGQDAREDDDGSSEHLPDRGADVHEADPAEGRSEQIHNRRDDEDELEDARLFRLGLCVVGVSFGFWCVMVWLERTKDWK